MTATNGASQCLRIMRACHPEHNEEHFQPALLNFKSTILQMEHSTITPNERVLLITQLAKLSFNHPSVVLTADVFQLLIKASAQYIHQRYSSSSSSSSSSGTYTSEPRNAYIYSKYGNGCVPPCQLATPPGFKVNHNPNMPRRTLYWHPHL